MHFKLEDTRVRAIEPLFTPEQLKREFPVSPVAAAKVVEARSAIADVLNGEENRFLAIVGPCSIHDHDGGMSYAKKFAELQKQVSDVMLMVMRVYFEKPRTNVGWKGFVTDPNLDGSDDIGKGLKKGREFLLEVGNLGIAAATEFLDPIVPQYFGDLVSWAAIGARTTESQTHREMSSGLSMPLGFKNGTDGDFQSALDAMLSARSAHSFLGVSPQGQVSVIRTQGNPLTHLVLRGGRKGPNYDPETLFSALKKMQSMGVNDRILVDCSHANSQKQALRQIEVWREVMQFHIKKDRRVFGGMLESYLETGRQELVSGTAPIQGLSITDACLGWVETEKLILESADSLRAAKR